MLQAQHLTKQYGKVTAISDLNFQIREGEIIGFLGPNGAGKSTTMNIITGALAATSGDVSVCGHSILEEPMEARRCIGYLPETPPLYPEMKVKEYIRFVFQLKHVPMDRQFTEVCEKAGISGVMDRTIHNLSKGYRQRVGLAQALAGNPPLLILDEPTSGMDPKQVTEIRSLLLELKKKHTIVFSSHVLSEIESVCSRLLILKEGKLIADDTPEALSVGPQSHGTLILEFDGNEQAVIEKLSSLNGTGRIRSRGTPEKGCHEIEIDLVSDTDIRRPLFYAMAQLNVPILGLRYKEVSLEELFLTLTGR